MLHICSKDVVLLTISPECHLQVSVMRYLLSTAYKMVLASIVANTWQYTHSAADSKRYVGIRMSAYTVLWRKPLWFKFLIREVPGMFVCSISWHKYDGSCWNIMAMSKVELFDCFSSIHLNWREQSHSLLENLKHGKINNDIAQLEWEKYMWSVSSLGLKG
jgi:hypothetical protein